MHPYKNTFVSKDMCFKVDQCFLLAHLLEVTAIEGECEEKVVLNEAIPSGMDSQTWLKALEKSVKTTLMLNFTRCLINSWSRAKDETIVSDFVEKGTVRLSERYCTTVIRQDILSTY